MQKQRENPSRGERLEERKEEVGNEDARRDRCCPRVPLSDRISEFPLIQGKGGIRVL